MLRISFVIQLSQPYNMALIMALFHVVHFTLNGASSFFDKNEENFRNVPLFWGNMLSYLGTHWGVHEGRAKVYIFLGVGDDNALGCERPLAVRVNN